MAPDADAGKSAKRADPFAPLTSEQLVGRRRPRDLCRERRPRRRHSRGLSAWRARQRLPARPSPAVRSRTLSRRAVRPARRRPQPPQGRPRTQHAAASDRRHGDRSARNSASSAGWSSAAPGARRWRWPMRRRIPTASPASCCAPPSSAPARNSRRRIPRRAAALLSRPHATISSVCCRRTNARSRSTPIGAASSIPIPPIHGPAARAWGETERILAEHAPNRTRLDLASLNSTRALPATPFMEAHYFAARLLHEAGPVAGGSRQARRHSRHHRAGPLRFAVSAGDVARAGRSVARGRNSLRRRRRPLAVRSRRPRRRDEGDRGSWLRGSPE